MEKHKPVGIWIRVSTEDQAQGESPEHHEARARAFAESKGWEVKTVYHLEAVSGKAVMHHSEAKRMLKDVKDGLIKALLFSKLARLGRDTKELLEFDDYFKKHGADLVSLGENLDTGTPAGRMFYTNMAAMAQWEREEIASRVAASVPIRAKLGKPLGGQASFGYRWENKKLVIDEKEAPIRKLVYELFLKHRRRKAVARELNDMGYRTRNSSKFSGNSIDRLLRDPTAKGEHRSNYTKSLGEGKKWKIKPKSDWVINPCPPIVSEAVWNECNLIMDEQVKKVKRVPKKTTHLLAGFIYCSCGKKMYVYHEVLNHNYACKNCKNRINSIDIDEIYHSQLKTFLLTEDTVETLLRKSEKAISEKETLLKKLKKDADKLQSQMTELVTMRFNKELTPEAFMLHHKPLEEQLLQINKQMPELEESIELIKNQYLSSDIVLRNAKDLYDRWLSIPFGEKRAIIEVITSKITIGKEDITVKLSYLPSATPTKMPEMSDASTWVHRSHQYKTGRVGY